LLWSVADFFVDFLWAAERMKHWGEIEARETDWLPEDVDALLSLSLDLLTERRRDHYELHSTTNTDPRPKTESFWGGPVWSSLVISFTMEEAELNFLCLFICYCHCFRLIRLIRHSRAEQARLLLASKCRSLLFPDSVRPFSPQLASLY